jgi:hypothetical protein
MRSGSIAAIASVAALATIVSSVPALASGGVEPRIVSATLEPETATVGDRLTLRIVVEHESQATAEGPEFGADFGGLEVVTIAPPEQEGGRTVLSYELTSFRTGRVTLPPLAVAVRGPTTEATLFTEPVSVSIESVLGPADTELRPLKPQLEIEGSEAPAGTPVVFVAIFAALTALGYVLFRRAAAIAPPAPRAGVAAAPPTAAEVARRDLDEIAASGLADQNVAEYYARIAAVTRQYLSARFAFPAYAMTRRELGGGANTGGLRRWPARLTANLLEQCDAAEYAGFAPAAERREADLLAAYEIIELGESDAGAPESVNP